MAQPVLGIGLSSELYRQLNSQQTYVVRTVSDDF